MTNWKKYKGLKIDGVGDLTSNINKLSSNVKKLYDIVSTVLSLLENVKGFVSLLPSQEQAVFNALYNTVKTLFDELRKLINEQLNRGIYFLPVFEAVNFDDLLRQTILGKNITIEQPTPQRIVTLRDPSDPSITRRTAIVSPQLHRKYDFNTFKNDIIESFNDYADFMRPTFDRNQNVSALVVAIAGNNIYVFLLLYLLIIFLYKGKEEGESQIERIYRILKTIFNEGEMLGRDFDIDIKTQILSTFEELKDFTRFENTIAYIKFLISKISGDKPPELVEGDRHVKVVNVRDNIYEVTIESNPAREFKFNLDGFMLSLFESNRKFKIFVTNKFESEDIANLKITVNPFTNLSINTTFTLIVPPTIRQKLEKTTKLSGDITIYDRSIFDLSEYGDSIDLVDIQVIISSATDLNNTFKPRLIVNDRIINFPQSIAVLQNTIIALYEKITLDRDQNIIQLWIEGNIVDLEGNSFKGISNESIIVIKRNTNKLGQVKITSGDKAYYYRRLLELFSEGSEQKAVYNLAGFCDPRAKFVYAIIKDEENNIVEKVEIKPFGNAFSQNIFLRAEKENQIYNIEVFQTADKLSFNQPNFYDLLLKSSKPSQKTVVAINTAKTTETAIKPNWRSLTINDIVDISTPVNSLIDLLENFFISSIPTRSTDLIGDLIDSVKEEIEELLDLINEILRILDELNTMFNLFAEGIYYLGIKDASGNEGIIANLNSAVAPTELANAKFVTGVVFLSSDSKILEILFPGTLEKASNQFKPPQEKKQLFADIRETIRKIQSEKVESKQKMKEDIKKLSKEIESI